MPPGFTSPERASPYSLTSRESSPLFLKTKDYGLAFLFHSPYPEGTMILRIIVTCLILGLGGALLAPLSHNIIEDENDLHLLPPALSEGENAVPDKLGQQLSLVSLGGLRSLVAAFLSVNAYNLFALRNWPELEQRYRQITALAPQNPYYWDVGSWHLAYNAASDSLEDASLRATEQQIRHRSYIKKGISMLKQGIKNNPDDWLLYARLGTLFADSYRHPQYEKAADYFDQAVKHGAPDVYERSASYALAQSPGREQDAYSRLLRTYVDHPEERVPAVKTILFALQHKLDIPLDKRISVTEFFRSPKNAYTSLASYYVRDPSLPKNGVHESLLILEPYKKIDSWSDIPSSVLDKLK